MFICEISNDFTCLTTRKEYFYWMVTECEELVGEVISGGLAMLGASQTVKKVVGSDVKIVNVQSNDDRSYHISSSKVETVLNFKPNFTVEDAVIDLTKAFEKKLLPNSLDDEKYFNIKRMQSINLK